MTIGNEDELEKLKAAGALVARTLQAMGQASPRCSTSVHSWRRGTGHWS